MKRDPDFFGEQELELVYIAKKLKEALKLESLLTTAGIDYLVEPDRYRGGVIFASERIGAFFYVVPEIAGLSRELLSSNGYRPFATSER
jgi:hypothetical protein